MSDAELDEPTRAGTVEAVLTLVAERYLFPAVAEAMVGQVRERLRRGDYADAVSGELLARRLTEHLQEISHDQHLRVFFDADRPAGEAAAAAPPSVPLEHHRRLDEFHNFGIRRAERLPGNVGYVELRSVGWGSGVGEAIGAAMRLVAHTDALLLDVRANRGGSPRTVALWCGHFFADPVHLVDFHFRRPGNPDEVEPSWTPASVPGPRYLEKPVYVLTSGETFSGAEELTYDLQALGRATVVGEPTAGGAHRTPRHPLPGPIAGFVVALPNGRPVSPHTGTNWEGVGVLPDLVVAAGDALRTAHAHALRGILDRLGPQPTGADRRRADEAEATLAELDGSSR